MSEQPRLPADELAARAQARGLPIDRERAERLRPGLESLLARVGGFVDLLPRETAPHR